jgi:type IV secretory pathway TraG/TraD family ATPase VirD4
MEKRQGEFQNHVTRTECETHFNAVFVNAMHNNIRRVFGSVMLHLHRWQKGQVQNTTLKLHSDAKVPKLKKLYSTLNVIV